MNEQPRRSGLTGEICLGCPPQLERRALFLLVRRLLSCFIERCPEHPPLTPPLPTPSIGSYQGLSHALTARGHNSLGLHQPQRLSQVLRLAFTGHFPRGFISPRPRPTSWRRKKPPCLPSSPGVVFPKRPCLTSGPLI